MIHHMRNLKQSLRLTGAVFFLLSCFVMPLMTCIQKATSYAETEATITEVRAHHSTTRKGRSSTSYTLQYAYTIDGREWQGEDNDLDATSSTKAGDKIAVLYAKDDPSDSRIIRNGGFSWRMTLIFMTVSGSLFFMYYRNRG